MEKMRAIVLGLFVLIFLAGIVSAETPQCYDSDSGSTPFTKGFVSMSNGSVFNDACFLNAKDLKEYYCDGSALKEYIYNCDKCLDGQCIYCSDSDFGKRYDIRGNLFVNFPIGSNTSYQDRCDGYYLEEGYCTNGGVLFERILCPTICTLGTCLTCATEKCFSNSYLELKKDLEHIQGSVSYSGSGISREELAALGGLLNQARFYTTVIPFKFDNNIGRNFTLTNIKLQVPIAGAESANYYFAGLAVDSNKNGKYDDGEKLEDHFALHSENGKNYIIFYDYDEGISNDISDNFLIIIAMTFDFSVGESYTFEIVDFKANVDNINGGEISTLEKGKIMTGDLLPKNTINIVSAQSEDGSPETNSQENANTGNNDVSSGDSIQTNAGEDKNNVPSPSSAIVEYNESESNNSEKSSVMRNKLFWITPVLAGVIGAVIIIIYNFFKKKYKIRVSKKR